MRQQLIIAKSAGFCFGVSRSVRMAGGLLESGPCLCLGELIHNGDAMRRLAEAGLRVIDSPEDADAGDRVLIRAHGASPEDISRLESREAAVTDATCPFVAKIHRIVTDAAARGRQLVILGSASHPEVRAITARCPHPVVVSNAAELRAWLDSDPVNPRLPITMAVQTTQTAENLRECEIFLKNLCTNAEIFDTICCATSERQEEAVSIASRCDAMVVIGGKHSANSIHLAELCAQHCERVLFIENASELDPSLLKDAAFIGVTAGASAPQWIIEEVLHKMSDEIITQEIPEKETASAAEAIEPAAVAEEPAAECAAPAEEPAEQVEKSFDEMLEDSLRPIYNGDTVKGVVVSVTPTEVSVDLGTKYSAFIPLNEFTEDGSVKAEEVIHVGDEVEAIVVRVNDVEGTAQLSKKRLDGVKNWNDIESAKDDGTIVEGTVTEENKGGIVVSVKGVRVFVPASQSGLPKDTPMTELLKQKVRLKITEVNRSRKRVVGSIRDVAQRERRERAEAIWNGIEAGKVYDGVVKSLTSYGAFVDIGGIDGMVHVSELSWNRVKSPADVVSVGDKLSVYVISFDKDARRISLGYRKAEDNPWVKFTDTYAVGDVVNVKIVKLMPFGAFAEVMPGVDGLIHISQIANRRIGQPSEALSVGQMADVKITGIDNDKQKISLSIRALSEPEPAPAKEDENVDEESGDDALVYEVSVDGVASGNAPQDDGE